MSSMKYGFAIAEYVFAKRGGLNVVESIKTKPSFNFNIWVNEVDDIYKLEHTPDGTSREKEQLNKFLIGTYPYLVDGNHYGTSILKSIAFDVDLLEILEEAQTMGVKALAIRPIIHWFNKKNRTKEDVADIQSKLFNMGSSSVVSLGMNLLPGLEDKGMVKSDEIQVLEDRASSQGVALIIDVIDMLQKRITRNLGLPDDLGFTSTGVGSHAKAREEMDMFLTHVARNQQYIEDVVNRQIIPAMVQYNLSTIPETYRLPNLVFESIEEKNDKLNAETFSLMIDRGVLEKDEPFIRENMNYPQKELEVIEGEELE